MKSELVKISSLKANPDNPRLIKDDKFQKLVKSIKDFPQMLEIRPVVVNDSMMVLGGNMRLKAALEAGLKEIPVIKASQLTEEQQKEFIIKDNVGFGEWDWDTIANEWDVDQVTEWGLDIPDFALKQEATEDDYEIPDEIETDIVLGDLFEIGEHRLLCGDSTNSDDIETLMKGEVADLVFTDPPYDYESLGKGGAFAKQNDKVKADIDHISKFDPAEFLNSLPLFFESKVINCFIFCNRALVPKYLSFAVENKYSFDILTWHKKTFIPNAGQHHYPDTEYLIFIKRSGVFNSGLSSEHYYKYYISDKDQIEGHPTVKPVSLIGLKINLATRLNKIVVDCFLGSGSTMVASHQLNRKCYGMEIDPKYCEIIIQRMLKLDPNLTIIKNGKPHINSVKAA